MPEPALKILIVDDEPGVLRFVRVGLGIAGFSVTISSSGQEAVDLANKNRYDVMLVDVFMEPISGLDVLQKLGPNRTVPVILFSADSSVMHKALEAGADDFIAKPFKPQQLIDKIHKVLAKYPGRP